MNDGSRPRVDDFFALSRAGAFVVSVFAPSNVETRDPPISVPTPAVHCFNMTVQSQDPVQEYACAVRAAGLGNIHASLICLLGSRVFGSLSALSEAFLPTLTGALTGWLAMSVGHVTFLNQLSRTTAVLHTALHEAFDRAASFSLLSCVLVFAFLLTRVGMREYYIFPSRIMYGVVPACNFCVYWVLATPSKESWFSGRLPSASHVSSAALMRGHVFRCAYALWYLSFFRWVLVDIQKYAISMSHLSHVEGPRESDIGS